MKISRSLSATLFGILLLLRLDARPPEVAPGQASSSFRYQLNFEAATDQSPARFVATFQNVSGESLRVRIEPKRLHAKIMILARPKLEAKVTGLDPNPSERSSVLAPETGLPDALYDCEYRLMTMTGLWIDPVVSLAAGEKITWHLPLESVCTLHGKAVSHASMRGSRLKSEIHVSALPLFSSEIDAALTSNEIDIP